MLRRLVFSAALFAAVSGAALAQNSTVNPSSPQPSAATPSPATPQPNAAQPSMGRSAATDSSSLANKQWLASDVYGASVYDPSQNKIGSVDDLVIQKDGTISKAVIGVGGFLGVGQKDVSVPFTDLKTASDNSKTWLVLNKSKDELKSAPAFDKNADALK